MLFATIEHRFPDASVANACERLRKLHNHSLHSIKLMHDRVAWRLHIILSEEGAAVFVNGCQRTGANGRLHKYSLHSIKLMHGGKLHA
jgi:hypothetical protein